MHQNAIVVVIDRLSAAFLGPYGNTWLDTPEFNRLATESTVFDFPLTDSIELAQTYRSYWRGLHSLSTDWGDTPNVIEALQRQGVYTQLVTDEPQVGNHELATMFSERVVLESGERSEPCDDVAQTQLAQLFAAATEAVESLTPPFLLWIHARGMEGPWDAPYALRLQYAEEGDPEPPDLVTPPRLELEPGYDPDELLGLVRAYAGQIAALDVCCGAFQHALNRADLKPSTLSIWTSPRGYPLGEHLSVGQSPRGLFGEVLHVPMFVRMPPHSGGTRSHAFVQPADLAATLLDWWQLPWTTLRCAQSLARYVERPEIAGCPVAVAASGERITVRTPAWLGAFAPPDPPRLYAKPDDRFEMNEVSARGRDVVEQLTKWVASYREAAESGFASFPLLPDLL